MQLQLTTLKLQMKTEKGLPVSVRLPVDLEARLKAVAIAEDRPVAATIRRAIEAYVLVAENGNA